MTWKLFMQTGNIETYLLLKQLENDLGQEKNEEIYNPIQEEHISYETKL